MKQKLLAVLGSAVLVLLAVGFSAAADSTYRGEIMDSACAQMGSHDAMETGHDAKAAKNCTLTCVKAGAKFVLYDKATKTIYKLDDQQKPMQFAGEKVKVTGTLDKATNTIHVTDIKAGS
jgi:hypothetical protein